MTYRIPLPPGSSRTRLDLIEPNSTAVQRAIRRSGLAAYEPPTMAALMGLFDHGGTDLVFFDIGANMGLYALMCGAMFTPSAVHAFEPTPTTAAIARKIARRNHLDVHVHEVAVSDQAGHADLHFSLVSDASNSLVEGFKASDRAVRVETVALDMFVQRTGVGPTVMKIDVETHEPAVLAGAADTIARYRPHIVIEVLLRQGRDHGVEIDALMREHDYVFYRLRRPMVWEPEDVVTGTRGSPDHDWLLAPAPLRDDFGDLVASWAERLAWCGPERNPRVPMSRSVIAAARRGGAREVMASARRYLGRGGPRPS